MLSTEAPNGGKARESPRRNGSCVGGSRRFIGLVLLYGSHYPGYQAGLAVAIDLVMVALFIVYLAGARRRQAAA